MVKDSRCLYCNLRVIVLRARSLTGVHYYDDIFIIALDFVSLIQPSLETFKILAEL